MYNIMQHSHSGLMYLIVVTLFLSVLISFIRFIKKNQSISNGWYKLYQITKWLMYLQFILGVVLLFISPRNYFGPGTMKSEVLRFYSVEHPLMMLIAIALVSIGLFKSRKRTDPIKKNNAVFIFYTIALVIVIYMIPWATVFA
jgi:hypothetical protein